jgi:hypothetical protein
MNLVGLAGKSGFPENTAKYECRPKAASDYPGHISTERQGFTRVYRISRALFDIEGIGAGVDSILVPM